MYTLWALTLNKATEMHRLYVWGSEYAGSGCTLEDEIMAVLNSSPTGSVQNAKYISKS